MVEKKLNDLFLDTLKDIYFAERQILKNLPKMAKAAKSAEPKKVVPDAPRPDRAACRTPAGGF
jgi:ferritin-like metal-binding protein YciE